MNPKWLLLLAMLFVNALAQVSFEESTSDDWTLWSPTESDEQSDPPPVDVTTTDVPLTEIVTAVTETEATTLPVTTKAAPLRVRIPTTTPPEEEEEEEEEEEVTTTEAITTTKRARSKSKTTSTTAAAATTTTTTASPLAGGLSEFLKRRKFERIMATTEVDPFIAILATATPRATSSADLLTESPVTASSVSNIRFNRRKNQNRKTTPAPVVVRTPDPIDAPAIRLISNRLNNNQLKRKTFGRTATTSSQRTTTEEFRPSTASSRPRFTPRRSSLNRASARKEVTTTASAFDDETTITDAPERSARPSSARRTSGLRFKANRI